MSSLMYTQVYTHKNFVMSIFHYSHTPPPTHTHTHTGEPEEVLTVMEEVLQNGWKLSSATTGHLIMAYLNK